MCELEILRGDTEVLSLVFTDENGDAYNLTGTTLFFTIKHIKDIADNDTNALLSKEQATHSDPFNGITEITLTDSETRALPVGVYKGDLQIVVDSGIVKSTNRIDIVVTDDITKRVI